MAPGSKTVLIIDDDEGMRDTLTAILRREYRVLRASTGETGLAILDRENVDVVLLDVRMPGISGFEVLSHIKEYAAPGRSHHDLGHQRGRNGRPAP